MASPVREVEWSGNTTQTVIEPYTQETGPTIHIPAEPLDLFLKFFTPDLIQHITTETNRYAEQCLSSQNGEAQEWKTGDEEIKAYLGFSIIMGITQLPYLCDYWSSSETLHNFSIASRISRKQFLEIQRYLHFINNQEIIPCREGHDWLPKV